MKRNISPAVYGGWLYGLMFASATFNVSANPISPEDALQEAIAYRQSHSNYFRKPSVSGNTPVLAYTATGKEGNCFYVFNQPSRDGFTIISADDRLPAVLGFSENGEFDIDRIPPAMKWWLSQYQTEITGFLSIATEEDAIPQAHRRNVPHNAGSDMDAIEPMLTTTWDQTMPYNNLCPMDPSTGQRSVTGCVATAMAQIMKYHAWPEHPTGQKDGYIFNGTTLEWNQMLDSYTDYNYTSDQAAAVALLMRQCGASVSMQYSSYASGAYSADVPQALATYFDYNASMEIKWRDYLTQHEWNKVVYEELAAGRPVYYSGQSAQGGHAFVCDGYLANDMFHFNWGWSGYQDGYFVLNALNPSTGGTGSFSGGYNANQAIITGLRPSKGEKKRQDALLSTGSFTFKAPSTFLISDSPEQLNLIYNPLSYTQTFNLGLKIIDKANPDNIKYVKHNSPTTLAPNYGLTDFSLSVPKMPDGVYKIGPAMFTQNEEWIDILVPVGMQRYVTLYVEGGKQTFSNEGPEEEDKSLVLSGIPQHVAPLYSDAPSAFRVKFCNVAPGEFNDYINLGLYNDDDPFAPSSEVQIKTNIPGNSSVELTFTSSAVLNPGKHSIFLTDSRYNELMEPVAVSFEKGGFTLSPVSSVTAKDIDPSFVTQGVAEGMSFTACNTGGTAVVKDIRIVVLKASDMSVIKTIECKGEHTVPAESEVTVNLEPIDFDLQPGDYYIALAGSDGKRFSLPHPLKVDGSPVAYNGLTVRPTDPSSACVIGYDGDGLSVDIPEKVSGYRITSISPDVFSFNDSVYSIHIPSGVTELQPASFYGASALEYLTMRSQTPVSVFDNVFAEEAFGRITVSGPDGYTNIYHADDFWSQFEMCSWDIDIASDIKVVSGLMTDESTGKFFSPYYVGSEERLKFDVDAGSDRSIRAVLTYGDKTETIDFWRTVRLPALTDRHGTVKLTTIDSASIDAAYSENDVCGDIYSIEGLLMMRDTTLENARQTLPAGIYILNNKKVVIR